MIKEKNQAGEGGHNDGGWEGKAEAACKTKEEMTLNIHTSIG